MRRKIKIGDSNSPFPTHRKKVDLKAATASSTRGRVIFAFLILVTFSLLRSAVTSGVLLNDYFQQIDIIIDESISSGGGDQKSTVISGDDELKSSDIGKNIGGIIFGTPDLTASFDVSRFRDDGSVKANLKIDVLSTGTNNNIELLNAQHDSWAQHPMIRNFFAVTEHDDWATSCINQTNETVYRHSAFCRGQYKRENTHSYFLKYMLNNYARPQWLQKKKNPVGWMCAQHRAMIGLVKVANTFREIIKSLKSENKGSSAVLPDYLFVVDDDTFVNVDIVGDYLQNIANDTSEAVVYAGCMVRSPVRTINATFPFGGWGAIYSRGAIERMIRPVNCSVIDNAKESFDFEQNFCYRVEQNLINEGQYYQPGMSAVDLLMAFLKGSKEKFCLHSDWVQGFFINIYGLAERSNLEFDALNFENRLRSLHASEIYRKGTGNCKIGSKNCLNDSPICHYMSATDMHSMHTPPKLE